MKTTTETGIEDALSRAVSELIDPDGSFRKKLQEKVEGKYKKDIVIKLGIDPTRPDLHLGHAVVLRKLRKFQDLGCKVVFLVGDYTAQIGDPSGKSKTRPDVAQQQVEENMKSYMDQVGKILKTDENSFSWIRNSDWFTSITDLNLPADYEVSLEVDNQGQKTKIPVPPNSFVGKAAVFERTRMQINSLSLKNEVRVITLTGLLWTLKHITHSRLIERDMFQERIKGGDELYVHEMLYPVLQAIDSSVMAGIYGSCDLEIGGTDQHFNMLMGRDVMKINKQEPQAVMTLEILPGTDGKEKMSKSLDNYIGISESAEEMYGKVMSIPDSAILTYFNLATYTPLSEIEKIEKDLQGSKINPRDIKARLAREIVEIYNGKEKADIAEKSFNKVFAQGEMPADAPEVSADGKKLVDILIEMEFVSSKSEFRRLITEGAIQTIEGEKIEDPEFVPKDKMNLRIGKKRFLKIN